MAFVNRIGNLLKQTGSKNVNLGLSSKNTSLFQAIRCMSSKLFVGGLSYGTDDVSFREAFSQYGEVVEARIIMDRETGRSRGFGFITYTSSEEASSAIQALDGQDLHGRRIRVNYATERPRTGGFGGGGYGGDSGGYGGGDSGGYGGGGGGYGGGGGGYGGGSGGYGGGSGGYGGGSGGYGGGGGGYGGGSGGYGGGRGSEEESRHGFGAGGFDAGVIPDVRGDGFDVGADGMSSDPSGGGRETAGSNIFSGDAANDGGYGNGNYSKDMSKDDIIEDRDDNDEPHDYANTRS